jgi:hypothetical protein
MFRLGFILAKVFDLLMRHPAGPKEQEEARKLLGQISIAEFQQDISLPNMESMILSYFSTLARYHSRAHFISFLFRFWFSNGYIVRANTLTFLEGLSYRSMDGGTAFYLMFCLVSGIESFDWSPQYCTRVFDNLVEHPSFAYHLKVHEKFSEKITFGPDILTKMMYHKIPYSTISRILDLNEVDPFAAYEGTTAMAIACTDRYHDYSALIKYHMPEPQDQRILVFMKYIEDATGKTYRDLPLSRNLFERHQEEAFNAAKALSALSEFSQYSSSGETLFSLVPTTGVIPIRAFDSMSLHTLALALNEDVDSYVDWMPIDMLEGQFGSLFKSIYCSAPSAPSSRSGNEAANPFVRRRLF